MSTIAVIPARYASSRFPGKPLAEIAGKPMIQWVYESVKKAECFDSVIVATDNTEIFDAVKAFGGEVEMTGSHHASGTDRVWEVASKRPEALYIFNVQGDEPLMNPLYLEEATRVLKFHHADIVTLKAPIRTLEELEDPNVVKVVVSKDRKALYFSRSSIPFVRDAKSIEDRLKHSYRHVGVYGMQKASLERFVQLPVSPLEECEKLEQLRALEAGMFIYTVCIPKAPLGVDTPEDLAVVESVVKQNMEMTVIPSVGVDPCVCPKTRNPLLFDGRI